MAFSTVYFISSRYGNYLDNYYTKDYASMIETLRGKATFSRSVNLGITDGVVISNTFSGDFSNINCAVIDHDNTSDIYRIIKREFVRKNMWKLTMVKDLFSKKYSEIVNSKVLVSRLGIPRNTFSPLLYQAEDMHLSEVKINQIKLNEIKKYNVYGYLLFWTRGSLDGSITWEPTDDGNIPFDIEVDTINDLVFLNKKVYGNYIVQATVNMKTPITPIVQYHILRWIGGNAMFDNSNTYNVHNVDGVMFDGIQGNIAVNLEQFSSKGNQVINYGRNYRNSNNLFISDTYSSFLGKIVKVKSTGKYYEIKRKTVNTDIINFNVNDLNVICDILGLLPTSWTMVGAYGMTYKLYSDNAYMYYMEELPIMENKTYTFSSYGDCEDQPFTVMYIPVVDELYAMMQDDSGIFGQVKTNDSLIQKMLYDLMSKYGGENAKLIDVQIIPYCPAFDLNLLYNPNPMQAQGTFSINNTQYNINTKDLFVIDSNIIPIYQVDYCSFVKYLDYTIDIGSDDYKISQQFKYNITSPSGANTYEFSRAKNGNVLSGFTITADLRPYASYYRLQPNYNNLYGGNYNDTRGLIWKEDSSITQTTSAWYTYVRQNVNYLNSFNNSLDYQRSQFTINQETNWGNFKYDSGKRLLESGIESIGFMGEQISKGGALGLVSGLIGGVAGMLGQGLNESIERSQLEFNIGQEQKMLDLGIAYQKAQFNYNLDNIKALPENVSKVSGVYQTNNYVPYVQVFSPTIEEQNYYNEYLNLYGVNVGQVIDLNTYDFNYISGAILKYNGVITNEEYVELQRLMQLGLRLYEED